MQLFLTNRARLKMIFNVSILRNRIQLHVILTAKKFRIQLEVFLPESNVFAFNSSTKVAA